MVICKLLKLSHFQQVKSGLGCHLLEINCTKALSCVKCLCAALGREHSVMVVTGMGG